LEIVDLSARSFFFMNELLFLCCSMGMMVVGNIREISRKYHNIKNDFSLNTKCFTWFGDLLVIGESSKGMIGSG
jgi:hypothetical protein